MDLHGKVALVTGSTGNLGPIWVETLKEDGADVFPVEYPTWDVRDPKPIFRDCMNNWGPPDIIINNAGIDNPPGSQATFWGNWDEIIEVNLTGAKRIIEIFLPAMMAGSGGLIINISSIMGNVGADWRNYPKGFEKPLAYNVSKAGLIHMAKCIATQFGHFNIRCIALSFGPYDNGKHDSDFKEKFLRMSRWGAWGIKRISKTLYAGRLWQPGRMGCNLPTMVAILLFKCKNCGTFYGGYTAW